MAVPVRIDLPPYDYASAQRLRAQLGVSRTLAQILVRRGFGDPDAAAKFLAADIRHPLDRFDGLYAGAERIAEHVARGSQITVHGDYDVDGVCATAILVRALRAVGVEVDWYLPSRIDDGYGLASATVVRLAERGTELLVTVDCAITAVEEVAQARAAGMDVIVIDHHSPRADGGLPDAPIVHPLVGGYPCPELCAAGVAYLLARALYERIGQDPRQADADLDIVALATVADCVPLVGENRRLVREGLRTLAATRKPGLQALMDIARVDPSAVDSGSIGFRLAPRINAAGRLRRADAGLELLLTASLERAREIAAELDSVNAERRDVETRILFAAEAQVAATRKAYAERAVGAAGPQTLPTERGVGVPMLVAAAAAERAAPSEPPAYVLAGEGWHPGVIGIVAARIAERYHRPTVLIALDGDEGTASGRSIPAYDLLAGLTAASGALLRYGGHRAAAGATVAHDRIDEFRDLFCAHAEATLNPQDLIASQRVDAVASGDALGLDLAEELRELGPFGTANPEPSLLIPSAKLSDPRSMGEGRHVRFTLEAGGARSRCVSFGKGDALPAPAGVPVDVAVRLQINTYKGAVEPQLLLRHAQPTTAAPIEIVGEAEFSDALWVELERDLDEWVEGHRPQAGSAAGPGAFGASHLASADGHFHAGADGNLYAGADGNLYAGADGKRHPGAHGPTITVAAARELNDARGASIAGLLCDLVATGEPVLAIAAHAQQRREALGGSVGGFALTTWAAIEANPSLAADYSHVVVIDPSATSPEIATGGRFAGIGWTHLVWSDAECELARRVDAWEYDLRPHLTVAYRALRAVGRELGAQELFCLLHGGGRRPRTGALAGRILRVLTELELVEFDGLTLTVPTPEQTDLEISPAFRAYSERLKAGQHALSSRRSMPTQIPLTAARS